MNHVTYIKIEPYLYAYWCRVMRLKIGDPLVLPQRETDLFFIPYLVRNQKLIRRPGKNKKGCFKDTTSYCEFAYNFTMSEEQPPLRFDDEKIPTKAECQKLFPFMMPKRIIKRGGVEMKTDAFFELHPDGAKFVREYIRMDFYISVFLRIDDVRNRKRTITSIVNEFVSDLAIFQDDPIQYSNVCRTVRNNFDTYKSRGVFDEEPESDSVRRKMWQYMDDRRLKPVFSRNYGKKEHTKV